MVRRSASQWLFWASASCALALVANGTAFATDRDDLGRAILNNDVAQLERLIQSGVPLNGVVWDGETPLMIAARLGREVIVDILLVRGASATATNGLKKTPLMSACESRSSGVVARLLRAGADPNSKGANGETAYLYGARYSTPDVLELLEKGGADPKGKDDLNRGALRWAAFQSNEAVIRFLLSKGVSVNEAGTDGVSPLLAAKTDAVRRLLIDAGADVTALDKEGNSVLTRGMISGLSVGLARLLIEKGADVNARGTAYSGSTPLMYATWFGGGNQELVRLLLANGARVNDIDQHGRTALMLASDREIASILISAGANLKHRNHDGRTALGEAIRTRHEDIAKLLRQHGLEQ